MDFGNTTQALNEALFSDSGAFPFPRTSRPLSFPTFACQVGRYLNHHDNNDDAAANVDDNAAGDLSSPHLPVKSVGFLINSKNWFLVIMKTVVTMMIITVVVLMNYL